MARLFEAREGIKVNFVSAGDAGEVLAQAILEKKAPQGDLIIGIDNNLLSRALSEGILEPYRSSLAGLIPGELILDPDFYLTPFDYGFFAINYDSEKIINPPLSLEELCDPKYRNQLVAIDPRTSTPGLGFLLWTVKVYGDNYQDYWRRLKPNILTVAGGWSTGYALFTSGEAPLVLSYTTSPPYHVEYEDSTRYRAAIFNEGHYLQIEGAGILKGGANPEAAGKFIDALLSPEFQALLPLTNYMYPVNPETPLPASYDYAPKPGIILNIDADVLEENREAYLNGWLQVMGN
jgi:thiamine transport system substrate-binding protein